MKKMAAVMTLVVLTSFATNRSYAQNFFFNPQQEDQITSILKFFGSVAGADIAHSGGVHGLGHIDVDLHTVIVIVPDEFKDLPQFEGVDVVPVPMLQVGVGLPGNLEVLGRVFNWQIGDDPTKVQIPDYQKSFDSRSSFTLAGVAVKYGLVQMFGLPKIMLLGSYHIFLVPEKYDFGDISNITGQAYISYGLGIISPFAAVGIDYSRFKISIGNMDTFSSTLFTKTVGLQVNPLPLLHVAAEYNWSDFSNIGISVGLSL
jgi:opacity protein-like surface antigen